jgi:hypothetical protein
MHLDRNDRASVAALSASTIWIGLAHLAGRWLHQHSFTWIAYIALPPVAAVAVMLLPRRGSGPALKEFVRAWWRILWTYAVVVSVGAVLILVVCSAVGYLPYSDRPGPGWGNIPPHFPRLEEISYFADWALLLVPICYLMGSLLFIFMAWLKWLGAPSWLARVFGGIFSAAFGMLAIASAGWYISISVVVGNIVGIICLLFGVFVLPSVSPKRETQLSIRVRASGIALDLLFITAILVYPFLRHR